MAGTDQTLELTPTFVDSFINKNRNRHQGNRVQHGHPGLMHWSEKALGESGESLLEKRYKDGPANSHLYVGMPFCIPTVPSRCGFCLFPSEAYKGKHGLASYLGDLRKEFRLLEPYYSQDRLTGVYFGGGTPNLFAPEHYPVLMSYVDRLYGGIPSDIEVTLEGLPPLFNEAKMASMKAAGINRISMGAQQTGELIKHSGRPQTRQQVIAAIELCLKHDMANSVDLIYGWPEQTVQTLVDDLDTVIDAGIAKITLYELTIARFSAFAKKGLRELCPDAALRREMYHIASDLLRSRGFRQHTVYDWQRIPDDTEDDRLSGYEYESKVHHFDSVDGSVNGSIDAGENAGTQQVCGVGFAAISFHLRGMDTDRESWIYRNAESSADYGAHLAKGNLPVDIGYRFSPEDVRLNWLYQTMQTLQIDAARYRELFGHGIREPLGHVFDNLEARGWLRWDGDRIHFIGDGGFHIPMLQTLIARKRMAEITEATPRKLADIPVATSDA